MVAGLQEFLNSRRDKIGKQTKYNEGEVADQPFYGVPAVRGLRFVVRHRCMDRRLPSQGCDAL